MKKIMDGNEACSFVSYNFTEVAGIYPITPASPMAELVDKWSNTGKLNYFGTPVKVVEMESEAGAAGMIHGSLQAGCLTTTYTASQGLLLMIPNMYKIAGELLPCVINVASRSLATHALSIFGDHQDIYAARSTGFAMIASSSVQQVMDLTGIAHLSTIKSKVPFINFFDGFRTSHELSKVDVIDIDKLKRLIDEKTLNEFRTHALTNLEKPQIRGTAQNEDIYFQEMEVRNEYYDKVPDIVNNYMEEINKLTGRNYQPFNYYGSKNATKVIVAMGSVCETIREVIDYLVNEKGENVGLLEVHLYRPFSSKYFLKVLPKSVKKIAVLDRTKEAGSAGEPLYLDVIQTIKEADAKVNVYGGRYGLSSKNTTPAMIKGVLDFLDSRDIHTNFTVGIEDDLTNLSIKYDESFKLPNHNVEFLVYGFGSDGMVSATKDLLKITGSYTNAYVQGYFQYDSKKSGGVTISHIRFGKKPISSTYYVEQASLIVCTKDTYLRRMRILDKIKENSIFVLNTHKTPEEVLDYMSDHDKKIIRDRKVKMFIIDAESITEEIGLGNKISALMEALIFKLGKIIDFDFALNKIKENLNVKFAHKGGNIAKKNILAIDNGLNQLMPVKVPDVEYSEKNTELKDIFSIIDGMEGDKLPVSKFINNADGSFDGGTSKLDKRDYSKTVPVFVKENCISCNLCSLVCPHAVVRPFLLNEEEVVDAPESVTEDLLPANIKDHKLSYTIGVSTPDCTGCGMCVDICPGKKGAKALVMKMKEELKNDEQENKYKYLFEEVSEKDVLPPITIKASQFRKPKFEFSGACSGCGETAYLKLLTQLFGNKMIVANATGCSSIYGASMPSMPYSIPWANSLFEDNAEFGYGIKIADEVMKNRIINLINSNMSQIKKSEQSIYKNYLKEITEETATELLKVIDSTKISELKALKNYIYPKSVWLIGGDGWAYDIGFNGIDHVLANKENVNILVLDTEVYSNTGGQSSKSSRIGSVGKFSSSGKKTAKKDLTKIALTYPHVYVGTISLGANPNQALKVLKEAESYNGPSIIIAYAPCIAQGILKGMNSVLEEQKATESGYFPLFHYNPETKEFKLDSSADFSKYDEFLSGEDRYHSLEKLNRNYKEYFRENKENAIERFNYYKELSEK